MGERNHQLLWPAAVKPSLPRLSTTVTAHETQAGSAAASPESWAGSHLRVRAGWLLQSDSLPPPAPHSCDATHGDAGEAMAAASQCPCRQGEDQALLTLIAEQTLPPILKL